VSNSESTSPVLLSPAWEKIPVTAGPAYNAI
jgi:hypothetical protein